MEGLIGLVVLAIVALVVVFAIRSVPYIVEFIKELLKSAR